MSTHNPPPCVYVPQHTAIEVAGDRLCSWCYRPTAEDSLLQRPLQRCSACRRVSYCRWSRSATAAYFVHIISGSASCQKQDWKHRHKNFCPRFQKVNKYDKEVVGDRALSLLELSFHQVSLLPPSHLFLSLTPAMHLRISGRKCFNPMIPLNTSRVRLAVTISSSTQNIYEVSFD